MYSVRSIIIVVINSVVPIKNEAIFKDLLDTEKRILCPAASIAGFAILNLLSMKGNKPSVSGFGTSISSISSGVLIILSAKGNSFFQNTVLAPKAEGSVHFHIHSKR